MDITDQLPSTIEGWAYRQGTDYIRETLLSTLSPRESAAHWSVPSADADLTTTQLIEAVRELNAGTGARWAISISHDHYPAIFGGSQNCIRDEERALGEAGWAYLHFCPARPLPMLSDVDAMGSLAVIASLNGRRLGVISMADATAAANLLTGTIGAPVIIIHHLLGHSPELVTKLIQACGNARTLMWAHDLFSVCPSVHLLRNGVRFCDAPPPSSGACGICSAGEERPLHLARMHSFFDAVRPHVLAPSATILKFWSQKTGASVAGTTVVPPCRIEFDSEASPFRHGRPLRVGFFGLAWFHKGWQVFESLARWHQGDHRYEFIQLGSADPKVPNIRHEHAEVSGHNRHAMVEAAKRADVDVVINWSLCYESFSFTAAEAIAAGAFVVARKAAGNVWPLVSSVSPLRGKAVESEIELQAIFADGSILDLAARADRRAGRLIPSRGAGEILLTDSADA